MKTLSLFALLLTAGLSFDASASFGTMCRLTYKGYDREIFMVKNSEGYYHFSFDGHPGEVLQEVRNGSRVFYGTLGGRDFELEIKDGQQPVMRSPVLGNNRRIKLKSCYVDIALG